MSQKQKFADLRNQLEKWRSHNEVHAKAADKMLYEFLSELLKLGEYEEIPKAIPEQPETISSAFTAQADAEEGDGGNSPEVPPDLP